MWPFPVARGRRYYYTSRSTKVISWRGEGVEKAGDLTPPPSPQRPDSHTHISFIRSRRDQILAKHLASLWPTGCRAERSAASVTRVSPCLKGDIWFCANLFVKMSASAQKSLPRRCCECEPRGISHYSIAGPRLTQATFFLHLWSIRMQRRKNEEVNRSQIWEPCTPPPPPECLPEREMWEKGEKKKRKKKQDPICLVSCGWPLKQQQTNSHGRSIGQNLLESERKQFISSSNCPRDTVETGILKKALGAAAWQSEGPVCLGGRADGPGIP